MALGLGLGPWPRALVCIIHIISIAACTAVTSNASFCSHFDSEALDPIGVLPQVVTNRPLIFRTSLSVAALRVNHLVFAEFTESTVERMQKAGNHRQFA